MLKIRRPLGRLIFNMGIAIPGKTVFLIETAPWTFWWLELKEYWLKEVEIEQFIIYHYNFAILYIEQLYTNSPFWNRNWLKSPVKLFRPMYCMVYIPKPVGFVTARSCKIARPQELCSIFVKSLKFERPFGDIAADGPVKCQNNSAILTFN